MERKYIERTLQGQRTIYNQQMIKTHKGRFHTENTKYTENHGEIHVSCINNKLFLQLSLQLCKCYIDR